jgi:glycosyltransferase involved in cell wall biosynthesis
VHEFVEVAAEMQRRGHRLRAHLAGPLYDESARRLVPLSVQAIPGFEYRGPLYEAKKVAFYREIDVLLFPTRYRHEAEPLVIHEAMAEGAARSLGAAAASRASGLV